MIACDRVRVATDLGLKEQAQVCRVWEDCILQYMHDCLGQTMAAIELEFGNNLSMSLVHARERRLAVTEFV
jgi:hypothetical protein